MTLLYDGDNDFIKYRVRISYNPIKNKEKIWCVE